MLSIIPKGWWEYFVWGCSLLGGIFVLFSPAMIWAKWRNQGDQFQKFSEMAVEFQWMLFTFLFGTFAVACILALCYLAFVSIERVFGPVF